MSVGMIQGRVLLNVIGLPQESPGVDKRRQIIAHQNKHKRNLMQRSNSGPVPELMAVINILTYVTVREFSCRESCREMIYGNICSTHKYLLQTAD